MENRISATKAIKIAEENGVKLTRTTLIVWLEKYDLGKKIAGRWYVNHEKFVKFVQGSMNDDAEKTAGQ